MKKAQYGDLTAIRVVNGMSPEQKYVLYWLVGKAVRVDENIKTLLKAENIDADFKEQLLENLKELKETLHDNNQET